jgi:hypothetical protein
VYQVLEPAQQRIRVLLLRAYVDLLCAKPTPHGNGSTESVWRRWTEAGIGCVVPLHRRSDRLAPVKAQVLAHPDLLAVPQRRGAPQRELFGVGELDPAAITPQHRRQPPTNAAAVQPHLRAWREGAEDVTALFVGESAQVELIVVAEEADP